MAGYTMNMAFVKWIERLSWALGLALMGFFLSQLALGEAQRSTDLAVFEAQMATAAPDMSLWSPERIDAWQEARESAGEHLAAILEIPELQLEVPVYREATDGNMDRGAGLIVGTAVPGEIGNMGIAGHRDGYFRVLKDIEVGNLMSVKTSSGLQQYRVNEILIVDPIDVEVLDPTQHQSLTLVTCYPFYFVGSAPQRFVVKADLMNSTPL
jgi:sortase A